MEFAGLCQDLLRLTVYLVRVQRFNHVVKMIQSDIVWKQTQKPVYRKTAKLRLKATLIILSRQNNANKCIHPNPIL